MKCYKHKKKEATGVCSICSKGICRECAVEIDNKLYCKEDVNRHFSKSSKLDIKELDKSYKEEHLMKENSEDEQQTSDNGALTDPNNKIMSYLYDGERLLSHYQNFYATNRRLI